MKESESNSGLTSAQPLRLAVLALLLVPLTGCAGSGASSADKMPAIATWQSDTVLLSMTDGILAEKSGCLSIRRPDGTNTILVLNDRRYTWDDKKLSAKLGSITETYKFGESAILGGGTMSLDAAEKKGLKIRMPDSCAHEASLLFFS